MLKATLCPAPPVPRTFAIGTRTFSMMSAVVDCPPEDVRIGMRVAVRFTDDDVPVFAPA